MKIARRALVGSVAGYAFAFLLGVAGWIDAGPAMLICFAFTFAIGISAATCVVAQLLSIVGRQKRPG
jgi:hypothetical protein